MRKSKLPLESTGWRAKTAMPPGRPMVNTALVNGLPEASSTTTPFKRMQPARASAASARAIITVRCIDISKAPCFIAVYTQGRQALRGLLRARHTQDEGNPQKRECLAQAECPKSAGTVPQE